MAVLQLTIELACDIAIVLLSIHPKELKAGMQTDIGTPMSVAALFTMAKRWGTIQVSMQR